MRLLFKQRMFSWFDSYDIYDEQGQTALIVKGQLSWGHCLRIMTPDGAPIGTVKEVVLSFLPRFDFYLGEQVVGTLRRELTFFKPKFELDCNGWTVQGDWMEWDYSIAGPAGEDIASVSKQLFNWTDTYVIDVADPANAVLALMIVLAIDAEKCSRG